VHTQAAGLPAHQAGTRQDKHTEKLASRNISVVLSYTIPENQRKLLWHTDEHYDVRGETAY
jgi:hypothetical protein